MFEKISLTCLSRRMKNESLAPFPISLQKEKQRSKVVYIQDCDDPVDSKYSAKYQNNLARPKWNLAIKEKGGEKNEVVVHHWQEH